jgi:aspartyl-tRNA synthetase
LPGREGVMKRTQYCGLISEDYVGRSITVNGWVWSKRDMGGVIFIDLKDREGILQTVFDLNDVTDDVFALAEQIKLQSVVQMHGKIRIRGEETYNAKLKTGTIELKVSDIVVLSEASNLPFAIDDNTFIKEDLRLKYRYLDIRRTEISDNLRFRHMVSKVIREYLDDDGFVEIETPILTKSTPEGARDYLVPSRVHQQKFYALPQSPQIFKQLLMVGGMDKYYQIARCFRDEDLRADRQPEFTQVDMEMSFVEQEDVLIHLEKLFKHIFKKSIGKEISDPFLRMTYNEAMDTYGCDKPDLRYGLKIHDVTEIVKKSGFSIFKKSECIRAINYKNKASMTRGEIEQLTKKALEFGAKGMAWIAIESDGTINSILTKYIEKKEMDELFTQMDAQPNDFIVFCADTFENSRKILGSLRIHIAQKDNMCDKQAYSFVIVTDFPLFEYSEEQKRFVAAHHPFTCPHPDDLKYMLTDKKRIRALSYDIVLNGTELGSGSIRIHDSNMQNLMFEALGMNKEQIKSQFGFLVKAFSFGTPPHGGFAFGLDRLIMILRQASSLRDVIAFPKIKDGSCVMTKAPDYVENEQLKTLHISYKDHFEMKEKRKNDIEIPIDKLSKLARLSLREEEKKSLKEDMQNIIKFASNIMDIDTSNVEQKYTCFEMENVFREDKALKSLSEDELLSNAKTHSDGYITVPAVLKAEV